MLNNQYLYHILHYITCIEIFKNFNKVILLSKVISFCKLEILLNANWVFPFIYYCKNNSIMKLQQCTDIIVADQPKSKKRFIITYVLNSTFNFQLKVTTKITQLQNVLTISSLFSSAIWSEREIFDLFGIFFLFNVDLRNILTDYGFIGFPLRKNFPLSGYLELFYDDNNKTIVVKQLELSQEFKNFFFKTLW